MAFGYNGRIAVVRLSEDSVEYVEPGEELLRGFLGGRGLGVAIMYRHGRGIEPLAERSLLCVMVGPLTGSGFPLANRLTLVFRSPLTGTIAWTNTGGYAGAELKSAGFDGLVIQGASERPCYLLVSEERVEIRDASSLWRLDAMETVVKLRHAHGDARILSIGPAGEKLAPIATVLNDMGRTSGVRHGVGCVMGSKRLKAIVIRGRPLARMRIADREGHVAMLRRAQLKIRSSPLLNHDNGLLAVHGTPIAAEALGKNEAIPFKNYRFTSLESYELVGGRRMTSSILIGRLTCSTCPVSCRRETASSGKYGFRVEGPDYAQISSLGTNCAVIDLEAISYMNYLCYVLGVDPIEMGNSLAMLAEATERGVVRDGLRWGDVDRMVELIRMTAERSGAGEYLALGAERAARELGDEELSMSVKGITIQNTDPRVEPAWGLLNATENFGGAAHIWVFADLVYSMRDAGVEPSVSPESGYADIAAAVKHRQDLVAVLDSLQVCAFSSYALSVDDYAEELRSITGYDITGEELLGVGERVFNLERLFNAEHGVGSSQDRLPRRFTEEPVPSGRHSGSVCELEPMLWEYYELRGWRGGQPPSNAVREPPPLF